MDENDEMPMFTGLNENGRYRSSIAENSPVGTSVVQVAATDRDHNPQFSRVRLTMLSFKLASCSPLTSVFLWFATR